MGSSDFLLALCVVATSGGGKTTVLELIKQLWPGIGFVGMGVTFAAIREGRLVSPSLSRERAKITEAGYFLEDSEVLSVLSEELQKQSGKPFFVLDGVIRSEGQLEVVRKLFAHSVIIHIDTPDAVAKERILRDARRERRPDDTPEKIDRRHAQFRELTIPAIEKARYLSKLNRVRFREFSGLEPKEAMVEKIAAYVRTLQAEFRHCTEGVRSATA